MAESRRLKVVLADDHRLFRRGMRSLLMDHQGIEVVGEAATGQEAVQNVLNLHPDIVIMDVRMPVMGGIAATREIMAVAPDTRVIVMTAYADAEQIPRALQAGAAGYLSKDEATEELVRAVQNAAEDTFYLGASTAKCVLGQICGSQPGQPAFKTASTLTRRQEAVLKLVAQGKRNREIATLLGISQRTVAHHISNIFGKINVRNRSEATRYAVREGIFSV